MRNANRMRHIKLPQLAANIIERQAYINASYDVDKIIGRGKPRFSVSIYTSEAVCRFGSKRDNL